MFRMFFYRSWGQWKRYPFFSHFSWRGLKQINMQGLILLYRQVHVNCLEGQKWKEQVSSPGVSQHPSLTAAWAPPGHQIHHRFICWQLLFLLTLLVCWKQSLPWKSLHLYNLWTMSNGFLQFNSPLLLGVSIVPVFLPVCPVLLGGELWDLCAAASVIPWRGIPGKRRSPWRGHCSRISLGNKFKTPVNTNMWNTDLMAAW